MWLYILGVVMIATPLVLMMVLARSEPAPAAATPVMASIRQPAAVAQHPHETTVATGLPVPPPPPPTAVEEKWGLRVSNISLTNGDNAVDVRYTVITPEKTALLTGAEVAVCLIDEASGTKLEMIRAQPDGASSSAAMPSRSTRKMMHMAGMFPPPSGRLMAGGMYSVLIPNWDGILKRGAKVALVVGDERVDDLVVK